ncbi:MAG: bifunctional diaminohydroxyphosphoribosylaminopyrimidine deaminase/5-amino-6-(5-phosphoribosylamino)uracil reductase RibD, partial [Methanobacteriota archaeon]
MHRALELARKGCGYTSPNPMVGAVIVKENRIIGEGYHPRYREKHAEVMAIENATESVEGSTVYCTMEPCVAFSEKKHNPPCADRLIQEHVSRVVIATCDPNPEISGKGIEKLRDAGIQVEVGILAEDAMFLNEIYVKYIQFRIPFVHLKIASSLDGRIATLSGDSRWITGEDARRRVHELRHQYDAVLVGGETVRVDNPRLTVRHINGKQPIRVVLTRSGDIPADCHLLTDEFKEYTLIITSRAGEKKLQEKSISSSVQVYTLSGSVNEDIEFSEMLKVLGGMGITSLLVEGGKQIFTEFIR